MKIFIRRIVLEIPIDEEADEPEHSNQKVHKASESITELIEFF